MFGCAVSCAATCAVVIHIIHVGEPQLQNLFSGDNGDDTWPLAPLMPREGSVGEAETDQTILTDTIFMIRCPIKIDSDRY